MNRTQKILENAKRINGLLETRHRTKGNFNLRSKGYANKEPLQSPEVDSAKSNEDAYESSLDRNEVVLPSDENEVLIPPDEAGHTPQLDGCGHLLLSDANEYVPRSHEDEWILPSDNDEYLPPLDDEADYIPPSHDEDYIPPSDDDEDYIPPSDDEDYIPPSDDDEDYIPPSDDEDNIPTSDDDEDYIPLSDEDEYVSQSNKGESVTTSNRDSNVPSSDENRPDEDEYIPPLDEIISSTSEPSSTTKKKNSSKPFIRKPDFCFFCETEVQNFARHITRNHKGETEVQRILTLPVKSLNRKREIASLRKKGNFIKNANSFFKPVHKSMINNEENYAICPYCFGLYSRKLLWKHKKICPQNKNPHVKVPLGEGQNLLIPNNNGDLNLRSKVFPKMRADKVSLTAKRDALICALGSRYLNTHREQHHISICSRKMRELAKILMQSQSINTSIKNLFDLLQPQFFDIVVQSVKVIAKYNPTTDVYLSPTFAMNISRSLKDCCDIAILHIIKRKYNYLNLSAAEAEANVKTFRHLLENLWRHEVSSQAANDLNTKTWNKITIVPLAADLKIFRNYLIHLGEKSARDLEINNKNFKAFKTLMETVFCRLLLLNRKRVGELQRLKMSTYLTPEDNKKNYEEFSSAVTPAEKVLLGSFKRVVTRGKRGRGVPILFSKDIQEHINLILKARDEFVRADNLFLFANCKSTQPIVGYKVMQKHAHASGAKNPDALTSTRLRKHLATLSQLFNMNRNDIEQLATFMGHTMNVHTQVYRLPDDIYQTAKIAKLLLLMEQGEAAKYKGKCLEEIDLDLEEEVVGDDVANTENLDCRSSLNIRDHDVNEALDSNIQETLSKQNTESHQEKYVKKGNKRVLIPWSKEEKAVVLSSFKDHIKCKRAPRRGECENLMKNNPNLFKNKTWTKIKVFIQNVYTNKMKCGLNI